MTNIPDINNKDLSSMSVEELVQFISPSSSYIQELKRRGVLRTKNIVGELGEYYAIQFYKKINDKIYVANKKLPNLTLAGETTKNVDALSKEGKIYSIKCISSTKGTTGSFWDPESINANKKSFDFLIIVILDEKYQVDKMLEMTWDDFFKHKRYNRRMNNYNISVTNHIIKKFTVISKK